MRSKYLSGKIVTAWLGILVLGAGVGLWARSRVRDRLLGDLRADALRCAMVFRAEELRLLTGTRIDEGSAVYAAVKDRLKGLREVHPNVRFVYIFRYLPARREVIYLADSEKEYAKELSRPGDVFPEAAQMPGLQAILAHGGPATEGPIKDSFGIFVTGYAAIGTWSAGDEVKELVGLDITAENWRRELLEAGLQWAVYVWLCLGLPFAAYIWGRMRSEQAVTINKLARAVEESRSAILIVGPTGLIEYVNAGLCQQMGYARHEVIGRNWRDFKSDETPESLIMEIITRVRNGYSWQGDWVQRRKGGGAYPVRGTVSPVQGVGSSILGFIAVLNDSSDQRMQEDALRLEKDRAENSDRAKGAFLATMSHEVRTPLNGIVGCANLLLDTPLSSEQREYLHTIRISAEALIQLTGDILDYSRLETGGLSLTAVPCDVCAAIEDVIDIFTPKAAEQGLELLHTIEVGVPAQIMIDTGRLRQILVNLIGNAVKFSPAGQVFIRVRTVTAGAPSLAPFERELMSAQGQLMAGIDDGSVTLEFSVRDTGIGIADEDRAKLFQPFSQLDSSSVRRYGGAGLGLVISRNLVRLMGGEIWLESKPGHGSTFFFTIRCRRATEVSALLPAINLNGARIAIITPSSHLASELETVIRQAGGQPVAVAMAGLSAVEGMPLVIDCDDEFLRSHEKIIAGVRWSAERVIGLVPVAIPTGERQRLRWHFRLLLNKPVHHRPLLELLGKICAGTKHNAI